MALVHEQGGSVEVAAREKGVLTSARPAYVVLMGAPGAGKGTQAELITRTFGLPHISSGDLFRDQIQRGTPLGREAQEYIRRGQLVPDDITTRMVLQRLEEPDTARGALLDGFPRTLAQAVALDQALARRGVGLYRVVNIRVPEDELLRRLAGRLTCPVCKATYHPQEHPPRREGICDRCGSELIMREDDRPDTTRRRLAEYFAKTVPVLEYYRARGVLVEVDGNQPIARVSSELLDRLQPDTGRMC